MTTQLITRERAQQAINQTSFTAEEATQIDLLIRAVSAAIEKYCRRSFAAARHDEVYPGQVDPILCLKQYPILAVERVARGRKDVIAVEQTDNSTNQRATVEVTDGGIKLVRVASGTTTTDESVSFASSATLSAVVSAINALGSGWSAALIDSSHGGRSSADLRPQGALNCTDGPGYIHEWVDETTAFRIDHRRGWLIGAGWPGEDYRIIYTAGYNEIPEDVQHACAGWLSAEFWKTKENPAGYPTLPPMSVRFLLDPYRRFDL